MITSGAYFFHIARLKCRLSHLCIIISNTRKKVLLNFVRFNDHEVDHNLSIYIHKRKCENFHPH